MDKKFLLYLTIIFLLYLSLNLRIKVLDWDAISYILNAKAYAGAGEYFEWHRPPILPLLIAIGYKIFGINEIIPRILGCFFSAFTVLAIYLLGREIKNEKMGAYSAILFSITPLIINWAPRMYTAIPAIGMMALALTALFKYFKTKNNIQYYLFYIISALAFLTRYESGLILIIGTLIMWLYKQLDLRLIKGLIIFALTLSPWLYFNWINNGTPFYSMSIAFGQAEVFPPSFLNYYLKNFWLIYTPPLALLSLIPIIKYLMETKITRNSIILRKTATSTSLLLFLFFFLYYQAMVNLKDMRYILPSLLGFSLLAGEGLLIISEKVKIFNIPYLISILLFLAFPLIAPYFTSCEDYKELGNTISQLPEGNIATPTWPYITYYSDKTAKWVPSAYEQLLQETQTRGIKYILVYDRVIEPTWATADYLSQKQEFKQINKTSGCYGTAIIFEYNSEVSGELKTGGKDIINSNAFEDLKILP